jgi:hypothetical protein
MAKLIEPDIPELYRKIEKMRGDRKIPRGKFAELLGCPPPKAKDVNIGAIKTMDICLLIRACHVLGHNFVEEFCYDGPFSAEEFKNGALPTDDIDTHISEMRICINSCLQQSRLSKRRLAQRIGCSRATLYAGLNNKDVHMHISLIVRISLVIGIDLLMTYVYSRERAECEAPSLM